MRTFLVALAIVALVMLAGCSRPVSVPSGIYCWDAGWGGHCWKFNPKTGCSMAEREDRKCPEWVTNRFRGK